AMLLVQPMILFNLIPIDINSQPGPCRHREVSLVIFEWPGNDIVNLIVVMTIYGINHGWRSGCQMKHSGCRNTEFAVTVHADAQLKGVAYCNHPLILTKTTPEMNVRQNYIDAPQLDARSKLVVGDQAHVSGQWDLHGLSHLAHSFQVPRWVF